MSLKEVSWKIKYANFRISIESAFSLLDQRNLGLFLTFCIVNNIFEFAKLGPKTYVLYWPGESNYVRFIVENV